jgi:hypothetical protein
MRVHDDASVRFSHRLVRLAGQSWERDDQRPAPHSLTFTRVVDTSHRGSRLGGWSGRPPDPEGCLTLGRGEQRPSSREPRTPSSSGRSSPPTFGLSGASAEPVSRRPGPGKLCVRALNEVACLSGAIGAAGVLGRLRWPPVKRPSAFVLVGQSCGPCWLGRRPRRPARPAQLAHIERLHS